MENTCLINYKNYGPYEYLVRNGKIRIDANGINSSNWNLHFTSILNILLDGVETDFVKRTFITVDFGNGLDVDLTIPDYWLNLMHWYLIVMVEKKLEPRHLFFEKYITRKSIKRYVDEFFIEANRKNLDNMQLNNIIDDMMHKYTFIDKFSMYLANTVNLEDTIDLIRQFPELDELIHLDISNIPLAEVKHAGTDAANKVIARIKESDHCMADFFRAGEGINPKQFKEFMINIGTKPNGRGEVYPYAINSNFITGGVNDILSLFMESSTGRVAQIIVEGNVGVSGYFARLLGLNNMDTIIHPNPNYICESTNFQEVYITDEKMLSLYEDRYYRLYPNGMEYLLVVRACKHLIGQTIFVRSPMTCASHARGEGICHRCYGELSTTNDDISLGKIAAEELSSKLTQMMLSAKHLLESAIKKMTWSVGFEQGLIDVEYNMLKLVESDDISFKDYKLLIDPEAITPENEEDYQQIDSSEYVTEFNILTPKGELIPIYTEEGNNMFITLELNEIIRDLGQEYDGKIAIDMDKIVGYPLFMMEIRNNDLSDTLNQIKGAIDKISVTTKKTRHELLQYLMETTIKGGLDVMSIHCEVILANQLRNVNDILSNPSWEYPNESYQLLTLSQALSNNPSITISLSYERISRALYNPLTFRKHKPSYLDLFFVEKVHSFLNNKDQIKEAVYDGYEGKKLKRVITFDTTNIIVDELDNEEEQ